MPQHCFLTFLVIGAKSTIVVALPLFTLYYYFRGGHEEHTTRASVPLTSEEKALAQRYNYSSSFLERPRIASIAKIFIRQWLPIKNDPKAHVVVLHGLHEHSGRALGLVQNLVRHDYAAYGIDLEGFGRSSGRLGYFENVMDIVDDVLAYIAQIRDAHSEPIQVFLMGGSMGGLITLHSCLEHQRRSSSSDALINGMILQAPALSIHKDSKPSQVTIAFARGLQMLIPKLPLSPGNAGNNSSESVREINERRCADDPLFYSGWIRVGTGLAILSAQEALEGSGTLEQLRLPYLLQHGAKDRVCHIEGSHDFHRKASSRDKTFIIYPDAEHDLAHEPEHLTEKLHRDIITWLDQRR